MARIFLGITTAQYTTYSVGTSYRGILGVTYSYSRVRGSTDTIVVAGSGLTSSTVPSMPTSYSGASGLGSTLAAGLGTSFGTFSLGATGSTASTQGPLATGSHTLTLSLTNHGITSDPYTLSL